MGRYGCPGGADVCGAPADLWHCVSLEPNGGFSQRTGAANLRDAHRHNPSSCDWAGCYCRRSGTVGRVTPETPLDAALGKIIYESVPFSLGVALARQLLSGGRDQAQPEQQGDGHPSNGGRNATLKDMGATAIGALFIGLTIAPTTEVPMLAADLTAPWLLALMAASLLISYGVVFEAGFANQQSRQRQHGIFQRPISETTISYIVALAVSAGMLWFFKQCGLDDPWHVWLRYTIVLGLPAAVGGAAGRLAA